MKTLSIESRGKFITIVIRDAEGKQLETISCNTKERAEQIANYIKDNIEIN